MQKNIAEGALLASIWQMRDIGAQHRHAREVRNSCSSLNFTGPLLGLTGCRSKDNTGNTGRN